MSACGSVVLCVWWVRERVRHFAKYVSPCMVRVAQTHKHGFVRFTQASPEKLDSATDQGRLTTRESSHGSGALPIPFLVSGGESASVTGDRNLIPGLG